jgi:hypothetical protein
MKNIYLLKIWLERRKKECLLPAFLFTQGEVFMQ